MQAGRVHTAHCHSESFLYHPRPVGPGPNWWPPGWLPDTTLLSVLRPSKWLYLHDKLARQDPTSVCAEQAQ